MQQGQRRTERGRHAIGGGRLYKTTPWSTDTVTSMWIKPYAVLRVSAGPLTLRLEKASGASPADPESYTIVRAHRGMGEVWRARGCHRVGDVPSYRRVWCIAQGCLLHRGSHDRATQVAATAYKHHRAPDTNPGVTDDNSTTAKRRTRTGEQHAYTVQGQRPSSACHGSPT